MGVLKVSMCVWRILGGCHEGISDVSGMYKGYDQNRTQYINFGQNRLVQDRVGNVKTG